MRSSARPSPRQRHWLTVSSRNGGNSLIANRGEERGARRWAGPRAPRGSSVRPRRGLRSTFAEDSATAPNGRQGLYRNPLEFLAESGQSLHAPRDSLHWERTTRTRRLYQQTPERSRFGRGVDGTLLVRRWGDDDGAPRCGIRRPLGRQRVRPLASQPSNRRAADP